MFVDLQNQIHAIYFCIVVIMEFIERLKQYMEFKGYTSTQFADMAGIPRPTLSQLLTGRNKKVSNELISKLHNVCEDLNIMWLMFGEGQMLDAGSSSENDVNVNENNFVVNQPILTDDNSDENADGNIRSRVATDEDVSEYASKLFSVYTDADGNSEPKKFQNVMEREVTKQRNITSIVVFYDDSSYETFTLKR